MKNKHILSALVENRPGVLSRTAGLFARRGFNIASIAAGETADPTVTRMTIVVDGGEKILEQVEKQLNKQIDVIRVRNLDADDTTRRELALIKVHADPQDRGNVTEIATIMKAKIVDLTPSTMTIEIADRPERVKQFVSMLEPYSIVEMVRTGMIAMQKGSNSIST